MEELRTSQQAALDGARADYDRRVTETGDAAAALARRQLEDYTRELGTLHRANGELTGQVATLTAQAGTAAARARRAEQAIARLRERLTGTAEAADELEEPMDPAVLSRTLHTLLDALPEDDAGEDTAG